MRLRCMSVGGLLFVCHWCVCVCVRKVLSERWWNSMKYDIKILEPKYFHIFCDDIFHLSFRKLYIYSDLDWMGKICINDKVDKVVKRLCMWRCDGLRGLRMDSNTKKIWMAFACSEKENIRLRILTSSISSIVYWHRQWFYQSSTS